MGCPQLPYYRESEYLKVSFKKELTSVKSVQKDYRSYELKNHLGNVLAVVTDRKLVKPYVNSAFDGFESDVVSYSSYYPFGMEIEALSANNSEYRYGYQGSEKDNEVKGNGNSYTTYFRGLDPRLGRWLSLDPKASSLPWQSPYCSMDNNPIWFNDPMGDKIKNGYEAERNKANENKNATQKKLDDFAGDDKSRDYKKLNKANKKALKEFNKVDKNYQMVEKSISDYKKHNPKGFEKLDNLTYYEGGTQVVDVYLGLAYNLASDYFETPKFGERVIELDGLTNMEYGKEVSIYKSKTKYNEVYTKKYGLHTIQMVIDKNTIDKGLVLSHEGGHAIYNLRNIYKLIKWHKENPGKSVGGHGGGNPSGLKADEEEDIYIQNKKKNQ